jgi:hypothetical protein
MKGKDLALIALVVVVLAVSVTVAQVTLRQTQGPPMATVAFFSNMNGYACFLNYTYPLTGAPVCLSDNPANKLPDNATVPLGSYGIAFFPFGTASNKSTWLGSDGVQVTRSRPYDVSSSYANITITGNGAVAVFVLPENTPIPEFNAIGMVAFSALTASLYVLRRRRR